MILNGKSALITGGTGALGQVVAERFLKEGASVAASYISEEEADRLPETIKKSILLVRANVTKEENVSSLFDEVCRKHRRVDLLVNIVGGFLPGTLTRDVESGDWDHMMNINLRSMFLCSREFLRRIGDAPFGRIISIAAQPVFRPSAGKGPYAVSKAGVVMLTQVLGEELKGSGITANAIAPSILKTGATMASMPGDDSSKWVTPEDVADLMLHLCSEGGRSINGTCIPIFGGV
jgi:NAD(P)-dependent dehydrogenase (short-subunit alcohol dehydrogenase family)